MRKTLFFFIAILLCFPTMAQKLGRVRAVARPAVLATKTAASLFREYKFQEAASLLSKQIQQGRKHKENVDTLELQLLKANMGQNMLNATEDLTVVDSVVVDKDKILSVYNIDSDEGRVAYARELLGNITLSAAEKQLPVFSPELADKVYYSKKSSDGYLRLYFSFKMDNKWGEAQIVPGLEDFGEDQISPYVMTDGTTMYFAAKGDESLGGYDIFMTRYNSVQNKFLKPENIGMPFNSPSNDYLYVIDENKGIGWFASDRFQPQGKVCVYIFIPNDSRKTLSLESESAMIKFARLSSIQDTWTGADEAVKSALKKLKENDVKDKNISHSKNTFAFVVNDSKTYTDLSDFKDSKAREYASSWLEEKKMYDSQLQKLTKDRESWTKADAKAKSGLKVEILSGETELLNMQNNMKRLEKLARAAELNH